jgi:hypothetical protein
MKTTIVLYHYQQFANPNTKAANLGMSPQAIAAWNNFENPKDRFSGTKHPNKCSNTILESPPKNKWGTMAKAWANKILSKRKLCLG